MRGFLLALLGGLALLISPLQAENWTNWRGEDYQGIAPSSGYPISWGPDKNILWKVALEGPGGSTPIVWEDRIILTSPLSGRNGVLCFDRKGNLLWQKELGDLVPGKNRKASGCNPSPVTDGQRIYVYYKSGDLACLDMEGNILWSKNLQDLYGDDTLWWDLGTSPVLTDKAVVVACIQSDNSYLVAMEKESGEVLWKQDRNLAAPEESAQSYATPVVLERDGRQIVVVLGADHVTAHDAATGQEIWRIGGLNPRKERFFRSIASPVPVGSILIAPYARGETLTAVRLGGEGDVTGTHVAWSRERLGADVPTPAARDGKVYLCGDRGDVTCLDAASGETLWTSRLERNRNAYSSSPVLAGDLLYVTREDGKTFVLRISDQGAQVIAENTLNEFTVATPVLVDGMVLIRTFDHLYVIGDTVLE